MFGYSNGQAHREDVVETGSVSPHKTNEGGGTIPPYGRRPMQWPISWQFFVMRIAGQGAESHIGIHSQRTGDVSALLFQGCEYPKPTSSMATAGCELKLVRLLSNWLCINLVAHSLFAIISESFMMHSRSVAKQGTRERDSFRERGNTFSVGGDILL